MTGSAASYLVIRGLSCRYGGSAVLSSIDLEVRCGEFLVLLGPSGSGKSTLLMALAGFAQGSEGSIVMEGRNLVSVPPNHRDIGFVFQNYALFPHMTVLENVLFPLRVRGIKGRIARDRALASLGRVGLSEFANRATDELSGGQRQRVAFARAVVAEPRLLLMDEPLSALDKNLREEMQVQIRNLHDALGITTIYVTHDQREAMTMADRIAVMNRGSIEQVAVPREIYTRPATIFVANFLGDANLVPIDLLVPDPGAEEAVQAARRAGKSHLFVRAESVFLDHHRYSEPGVSIQGNLAQTLFHGDRWAIRLTTRDGIYLRASVSALDFRQIEGLAVGATLPVWIPASTFWFLACDQATGSA